MDSESERNQEERLLPRALACAVGVVCRYPWTILVLTCLSCVSCAAYTWTNLTYLTHRTDLISSNKDYLKRWRQYVEEFGDDEDMIVVVRGDDRVRMVTALDELADKVAQRPDSFERLFYRVDLRPLNSRALLFLTTEQIRQVQGHVQGLSLLLEPPVLGTFDPWIGWKSLSVRELLRDSERKLKLYQHDPTHKNADGFFKQIAAVADGASDFLNSPARYCSPWRSSLPDNPSQEPDQLATPRYFFSPDGKLALLLVSPVKEPGSDSFTAAQKNIDALREILTEMKDRHEDLEFGLTGLPVLENDEMLASQSDSNRAAWLALLGIALLYLVVYRGLRYPFMTVAALMVGTVWALGWLTLTVGHLNILSAAFAVMLIGMGDYGVLWVTRFGQERQAGHDVAAAMRQTALHVGPSICTAALATAFAFFATMLADLKAVTEFGWISGCGVLLCAASCFIVTPALLAIFDFRVHFSQAKDEMILSLQEHREARREWIPWLMRRPKWVFAGSIVVTLTLAGFASFSRYDHNLLNMQAQSLESVQWEKKLIEHMNDSSWHAVSWTTTPEEALALKAKYEHLPEVSNVVTIASLIPADQDRKVELLRDIQHRLRKLPKRGEIFAHAEPNLDDIEATGTRILGQVTRLQKERPNAALAELQRSVEHLLNTIRKGPAPLHVGQAFGEAEHSEPPPTAAKTGRHLTQHQLQIFEQWMARDLAEDLHRLRDVAAPTHIGLDDLPSCLRERYIGRNGKWLVRVFGKDSLWNFEPLARFITQVRTVDPEATGKPFTTLEGLKAMQYGFLWAGVYALLVMMLVLFVDFGRIRHTLVALLPLGMGMIATLGIMALFGVALNPANMIAFPLILGVGADNGVHVLHDFRSRDRSKRYRLSHATGRGIMVAALTTILGFGALMISQHAGMASLGLILAVGVTCCMATALVFLPALLYVMGRREKSPEGMPVLRESKAA